jgi:hypothetical protein
MPQSRSGDEASIEYSPIFYFLDCGWEYSCGSWGFSYTDPKTVKEEMAVSI